MITSVDLAEATQHWYQLSWVDWISVAGVPLAFIGLYLTWRQARDAVSSAEAASAAVGKTERRIRLNLLMVQIPQLTSVRPDLENAIDGGDSNLARLHLNSWSSQAANIRGIIALADPEQTLIPRQLQQSMVLARTAGTVLLQKTVPTRSGCARAYESIALVCDSLITWLAENSTGAQS